MIDSVTRITLDLQETNTMVSVSAKRGDTGRRLLIHLTDGGSPYLIGSDCSPVFTAKKPDGTVLFNWCTMENNEICYAFTEQTCAVAGSIPAEIRIYGNDSRLITSACFTLAVHDTVFHEEDVISSDEMNALDALVLETEALKNEIRQKLDNGDFIGPPGPPGAVSFKDVTPEQMEDLRGKSAYDFALEGGYTGTEAEFAQKLAAEYLSKAGGELTGGLTAPMLAVSQRTGTTQAIRFLHADDSMKLTIYPGSNGNLYVRHVEPNTQKSEYFTLPVLTPGITDNATYKILTSKELVSIEEGGTGASTAAQALANLGGISIVKVWENANQNSEFPGQEIAAAWAKDYDLFIVLCRRSTETQSRVSTIIPRGYGVNIIGAFFVDGSNGPSRINSRSVMISKNTEKVTFGDNYRKLTNETEPTTLNTALIPTEIYGIKGVTV